MNKTQKPEPDDKEQSQRFIDTARELGADENEEAFERALGIINPPKKPAEAPSHSSVKPT